MSLDGPSSSREFIVRTHEHVEGVYRVTADSEEEAREHFARKPGQLIDFEGVEQEDYMAYEVDVMEVSRA